MVVVGSVPWSHDGRRYAERDLTPGSHIAYVTSDQVCSSGWASAHRHVALSQRHEVFNNYKISYSDHSRYEFDHLIPLELGGDNANTNLWPQPLDQAYEKDNLEDKLHDDVCSRHTSLRQAWRTIRRRYVK